MDFWVWEKEENNRNCEVEMHSKLQFGEEMKGVNGQWSGHAFFGYLLPNNQKQDFPKLMASPIRIFYFHTLPFPRINYLNQFLKKINDWVQKDKKGSLQLYGFSH